MARELARRALEIDLIQDRDPGTVGLAGSAPGHRRGRGGCSVLAVLPAKPFGLGVGVALTTRS